QDPCRAFICGWLARGSPLPEWMRPDRVGAILLAASFTWRGLPVDVAVPVGQGPEPKALEWLTNFATTNGRPLLYRIGEERYAFGPRACQTEMHERLGRGEQPWA